jgi:hypothetical protein
MLNKPCRVSINNNNPKSLFCSFEIITVRECNDYCGGTYLDEINTADQFLDSSYSYDDPFYRVYGVYKQSLLKSPRFIADFCNIKDAFKFIEELVDGKTHFNY